MENGDEENLIPGSDAADGEIDGDGDDDDEDDVKEPFRGTHFTTVLSKIDEVDESGLRSAATSEDDDDDDDDNREREGDDDEDDRGTASPHVMWKAEDEIIHIDRRRRGRRRRPKSANCVEMAKPAEFRRRPASVCATFRKSAVKGNSDSESNSESSVVSTRSGTSKCGNPWNDGWETFDCRPTRTCDDVLLLESKASWVPCSNLTSFPPRKCCSNPNLRRPQKRTAPAPELRIEQFKRSLKLLGLEVTDFGIYDNSSDTVRQQRLRGKLKRAESTISTKIVRRSISLDGLKEIVKEAWLDDRLDSSHRRLLAQAAYEEWYFRKAEEAHRKLAEERMKSKAVQEKLESELRLRRERAEEEFNRWVEEKKSKTKTEKKKKKAARSPLDVLPSNHSIATRPPSESSYVSNRRSRYRLTKSKEEVELAYRRWKRQKDKLREEKHKIQIMEEARRREEERQKEEKKAMAERAFNEWKKRVEDAEKKEVAEEKSRRERKMRELEKKRREKENNTSFQTWKDMKDKELMLKRLEKRNEIRIANALRCAQMEERMYEAEQAFEEWLERIEMRERSLHGVLKAKKSVS